MATITDPSHVPLSGRGAELERLEAALAGARAQRPTLVVVDGPGGIGKTALLRSFVEGCDAQVLWSSGETFERAVPFAIADQLLRLARPGCAGASVMTIGAAHYTSVGLTILEALGELQRTGPVVVVVDDAHWADPASLRALLFAFRRLVTDAVLLVLTARSEDLHALPDGFLRIAQSPQGVELSLGPLGLDDARALVRGRELPLSGPAIARVHNLSAGVPLHLCALLDEFGADGDLTHLTAPPSYAALIVGRLSELRDDTRRLVEAAAVVGRRATIDEVARIAGVEPQALLAVDEAVRRDLIRISGRSLEFVHPLIRSAVHDVIAPARLAEFHTAAAALVDEPGLALRHRARAAIAPDERLAADLESVARRAVSEGNWVQAADFFSEAAELSVARADRERRLLDRAGALCDAGDLLAARSLLPDIHAFRVTAEREFMLGRIEFSQLEVDAAEQHFHAAWAACPPDRTPLRLDIATELAYCAYFRLDARTQLVWAERAAGLVPPDAAPRVRALALALNGRLAEGLAQLDQWRGAAVAGPHQVRGRLRMLADDLRGARADLSSARVAAARGPSRVAAMALGRLSMLEYLEGHWDVALTCAEQGLAACVDRTDFAQITAIRAPAVLVLAARGAWAEAEQHLRAMHAETWNIALPAVYTALAGAHLGAARGEPEAVLTALEPILALRLREGVDEPGVWPWQGLYADALTDVGRLDEAQRFLDHHLALAQDRGRTSMIGRLTRSAGRLAAARGDHQRAQLEFRASAQALADVGLPYELALTELDHGRVLRRRRQRRAAVELLANARDRFTALGAEPALAACERELQASGLTPKRPAAKGIRRLTPQELTIARLVVDGMTNREIAEELMVSTKTIEVHLTSVYAKLEVASRAELRARARRGELDALARTST